MSRTTEELEEEIIYWHSKYINSCKHTQLSALSAKLREWEWMPIETAPKDGTAVLTWASCVHGGGYTNIFSYQEERSNKYGQAWYYDGHWGSPTHWMPLPTPPKKES